MTDTISMILQAAIALGLLNVWLLRAKAPTAFRGGESRSLREEFDAYGLPGWAFYTVGTLKVGSAVLLLVGIWAPVVVLPAAALIAALMVGAVAMHVKVQDPPLKALPAVAMLAMSGAVCALQLG